MTEEKDLPIPVIYIGTEDVPILFGNQFVIQYQAGDHILTVGQFAPPILLGDVEAKREQARELTFVPVRVVARIGFSAARLKELVSLLQGHLARFEKEGAEGTDG